MAATYSDIHYKRIQLLKKTLVQIVLLFIAFVVFFPIMWMISQSLTPNSEVWDWPPQFIPQNPTLENYQTLFTRQDLAIGHWFMNSLFVSTITTILTLFITSLAAYSFARLRFPGRDVIFFILLSALVIPAQVTLIPIFLLMRDLKWLDTYHALIWPAMANVFAVFMLRQFFLGIPRELEEAAILDGATRFGIYWRIILPMSSSALTALAIFVFLGSWNDLFWPLIVLNRLEMRTLPVGLTVLSSAYYTREQSLVQAGAVIASVPVLIFYAFFQRQILKGITFTGMAGI
ncbi:MAG: carbohydrate ABC transporter permease [Anaerolineae bacterium]|nr:carbohydrate ABC transporter permease [Anaerolineae bacterium]